MNKEIEVKELRIGNYITFDGGIPTRVYELTEYFINDCHPKETNIQGISLSPAILEKCGFEKLDDIVYRIKIDYFVHLNILFVHGINIELDYFDENEGSKSVWDINLEYLHQLQNLYFALTGQELQITL